VGRRVALKRLLEQAGERARARFEREARLGAGLEHPGIARLLDAAFEGPGAPYLVQELVRGKPLERLVDEDEPAPVRRAVELVAAAARALEHAHGRRVVHRDVKPQNIMVRDDGSVCVLDLGLARGPPSGSVDVTATNQILGTPAYLAPEQITDARHAGPPADVYGLGGTLYALLVGAPPFTGPSGAILAMVRATPPDPPSAGRATDAGRVDPALDRIVLRCLAKEPARRYPTAAALADDLDGWLKAPPPGSASAATAPGAARTVLVGLGGVLVGGLLATGLFVALRPREAPAVAVKPPVEAEHDDEPEVVAPTEAPATEPPAAEPPPLPPATELPTLPKLSAAKKTEIKRLLADAGALGKNKDFAGAEELCTQAIAVDLTTQALADRGYWRYRRKDYAGAAADFAEAARLEPKVALHHANLGMNLLQLGRLEEAAAAVERAIVLDPKESTNYTSLSDIRFKQGDKVVARAVLEQALLVRPEVQELWAACGFASFRLDDYRRAAECYAQGVALAPKNDRLWANLSYNRALAGDLPGAFEAAEKALALDGTDPFNWRKRAFCRFLQGDLEAAIADYERAIALDPADDDARKNIALCREQLEKRRAGKR
jgi:tetratricopeptide (TPR) repeat protein